MTETDFCEKTMAQGICFCMMWWVEVMGPKSEGLEQSLQCEAGRGIQHVYADTAELRAAGGANVFTRFTLQFSMFGVIATLAG